MAKKSTEQEMDAIELLKSDHKKVKALFKEFEDAKNDQTKSKLAKEAIHELKVHAAIEEEIFYPAVREAIEDEDNLMNEAQEEHHVAKILIAELDQISEFDEMYEAKFIVLAENIRHHIKEEEDEMLPEAKKADLDMDALGAEMMERKQQLMAEGIPTTPEQELVESDASR